MGLAIRIATVAMAATEIVRTGISKGSLVRTIDLEGVFPEGELRPEGSADFALSGAFQDSGSHPFPGWQPGPELVIALQGEYHPIRNFAIRGSVGAEALLLPTYGVVQSLEVFIGGVFCP